MGGCSKWPLYMPPFLLRTSCNVGKIINMCLDMSRSHGVTNTQNFRVCNGSQQFQKMSGTRFSMNTFRRQTISTPTLRRQILQRLLKRRRFGTLTGALFLGWLTCLLHDLSLASVSGPVDKLLLQIHGRAYSDASGACCGSDDVLVQEIFS